MRRRTPLASAPFRLALRPEDDDDVDDGRGGRPIRTPARQEGGVEEGGGARASHIECESDVGAADGRRQAPMAAGVLRSDGVREEEGRVEEGQGEVAERVRGGKVGRETDGLRGVRAGPGRPGRRRGGKGGWSGGKVSGWREGGKGGEEGGREGRGESQAFPIDRETSVLERELAWRRTDLRWWLSTSWGMNEADLGRRPRGSVGAGCCGRAAGVGRSGRKARARVGRTKRGSSYGARAGGGRSVSSVRWPAVREGPTDDQPRSCETSSPASGTIGAGRRRSGEKERAAGVGRSASEGADDRRHRKQMRSLSLLASSGRRPASSTPVRPAARRHTPLPSSRFQRPDLSAPPRHAAPRTHTCMCTPPSSSSPARPGACSSDDNDPGACMDQLGGGGTCLPAWMHGCTHGKRWTRPGSARAQGDMRLVGMGEMEGCPRVQRRFGRRVRPNPRFPSRGRVTGLPSLPPRPPSRVVVRRPTLTPSPPRHPLTLQHTHTQHRSSRWPGRTASSSRSSTVRPLSTSRWPSSSLRSSPRARSLRPRLRPPGSSPDLRLLLLLPTRPLSRYPVLVFAFTFGSSTYNSTLGWQKETYITPAGYVLWVWSVSSLSFLRARALA